MSQQRGEITTTWNPPYTGEELEELLTHKFTGVDVYYFITQTGATAIHYEFVPAGQVPHEMEGFDRRQIDHPDELEDTVDWLQGQNRQDWPEVTPT